MKILIADDNHSVRRALQVMLEALGHEVVGIAVDGRDAIDMYSRFRPGLVFMDVRMPNLGGLASLQQIIEQFAGASVIVYTGGETCNKEAFAAGAQQRAFFHCGKRQETGDLAKTRARSRSQPPSR